MPPIPGGIATGGKMITIGRIYDFDAAHMLTDLAALGLSLFALNISARPATHEKTYGYMRAEILAALANGVFLILISLYFLAT